MRELTITDLEAEILAAESIHPCTAFSRRSPLGRQEEKSTRQRAMVLKRAPPKTRWIRGRLRRSGRNERGRRDGGKRTSVLSKPYPSLPLFPSFRGGSANDKGDANGLLSARSLYLFLSLYQMCLSCSLARPLICSLASFSTNRSIHGPEDQDARARTATSANMNAR